MDIRIMKISDLRPADYNPRQDLQPGDPEYEKIANSLTEFGYVEPVVWNEQTGNVVGGHQRLKVLAAKGMTEIEVSVVNMSLHDEKILNVALNKIGGRWDTSKLTEILQELKALTMQYDHISDLLNEDFSEFANKEQKDTFTMTFSLPAEAKEAVQQYVENTENAKMEIATAIINKVKGVL